MKNTPALSGFIIPFMVTSIALHVRLTLLQTQYVTIIGLPSLKKKKQQTNKQIGYTSSYIWKGIRAIMLFDLLTCIMQCCYIQCMIIQCLIFLLQFQFDFITFHFFFVQSCFRAFDICPSSMQDFHCAVRYAILRSTIIHTPSCHYSYFVMPSLLRLC